MRGLKFRAWSKKHNKFLKITGIQYDDEKFAGVFVVYGTIAGIPNTICLDPEAVIVEQYTGLKDNNGKEIYEGDILEYDWYIIGDKPAYRTKEQVVFDDMGARVGNDRIRNCSGVEVIGNIHENAELLGN